MRHVVEVLVAGNRARAKRLLADGSIECLVAIAARVGETDFRLVALDIDSDSYVVMLLPDAVYRRATLDADALGLIVRDIREHDPNA